MIVEQAARTALDIIHDGEWVDRPRTELDRQTFYSRLSNIGFRAPLVVDP